MAAGTAAVGLVASLYAVGTALALPTWQAPSTVTTVRGIPAPMAAIDRSGRMTVVFADAPMSEPDRRPGVYQATRQPGASFGRPARLGVGREARVATSPDGRTAVAWIDGDRIRVATQPAPGRFGEPERTIEAPGGASDLRLAIDGSGRATLVWKSLASSDPAVNVQLRAASVAADGTVGAVQELGPAGECRTLSVDGNLAGDVVAHCFPRIQTYVREAGAELFESVPLDVFAGRDGGHAIVDGAGSVTVFVQVWASLSFTQYVTRPRGGSFGPLRELDRPAMLHAQEDRTVAAWSDDKGRLTYAIRPAGGSDFAAPQTFGRDGTSLARQFEDVTAPLGALPLISEVGAWRGGPGPWPLDAVAIRPDGSGAGTGSPPLPGAIDFPGNVAAAENGLAVATWEQRCGEGFAVMAMVLDERRGTSEPPCQDRAAPKVLIRPKRARLVGRSLRFRAGCDEACRLVVRTRVLRRGQGRPLATAKTPRPRALPAGAYRAFRLRLRAADAARVRVALARGGRVSVRFALSVRDEFENGAVRRVSVPLRR